MTLDALKLLLFNLEVYWVAYYFGGLRATAWTAIVGICWAIYLEHKRLQRNKRMNKPDMEWT